MDISNRFRSYLSTISAITFLFIFFVLIVYAVGTLNILIVNAYAQNLSETKTYFISYAIAVLEIIVGLILLFFIIILLYVYFSRHYRQDSTGQLYNQDSGDQLNSQDSSVQLYN